MELATQPVTENRDAYYWRLLATAASFALFGWAACACACWCFRCSVACRRCQTSPRARHTVSWLFWFFVRFMARAGVLTYDIQGAERLGRPGR
jgi:hypothetical protein